MNINYDYYRVFYYVGKYKSFTGAAGALLNNQPNITRMMKKLEEELGCTLFVRQRHGVTLTPEGEKLYAHISIAFEHILCGEQEIARNRSLQSGIITIAASEIALHCVLLPVLKNYRKAYPGIHIRVSNHSTPQAIDVLKKGLADFAIVTEPFYLPAGLSSNVLRNIQEVPVEAATADQILPMVKSDLGIGFVPIEFLENENMENLVILNMKPAIPPRNICILKRKGMSLSVAASELESLIWRRNAEKTENGRNK